MSPESPEEHYQQTLKNRVQSFKGYVASGVVKGKYWYIGNELDRYFDYDWEVCRENPKAEVISLNAAFPSGHLYPPTNHLYLSGNGMRAKRNPEGKIDIWFKMRIETQV